MSLVKSILESAILAAFQKQSAPSANTATAQSQLAADLATAIDLYIKSAQIITPPGQAVVGSLGPGVTSSPSPPAKIS
jgi:hypothetical protein